MTGLYPPNFKFGKSGMTSKPNEHKRPASLPRVTPLQVTETILVSVRATQVVDTHPVGAIFGLCGLHYGKSSVHSPQVGVFHGIKVGELRALVVTSAPPGCKISYMLKVGLSSTFCHL